MRAQLMGGSRRAIARVARLYDTILMDWMRRGEVHWAPRINGPRGEVGRVPLVNYFV